jgi:hypothetical protein
MPDGMAFSEFAGATPSGQDRTDPADAGSPGAIVAAQAQKIRRGWTAIASAFRTRDAMEIGLHCTLERPVNRDHLKNSPRMRFWRELTAFPPGFNVSSSHLDDISDDLNG